uniref:U1 small nuclear ribonucleoprotein C n=1 Tax=Oryzias latipes TaxID=8090 RepID=A0A3P9J2H6_ORYLA
MFFNVTLIFKWFFFSLDRFYCDYCDTYLTHDSPSVRKTHCSGRKHKENVKDYYQKWMEEQAQSLIDKTSKTFGLCCAIRTISFHLLFILTGPPRPGMLPTPPMGGPPMMPMMGPPPHGMMPGGPEKYKSLLPSLIFKKKFISVIWELPMIDRGMRPPMGAPMPMMPGPPHMMRPPRPMMMPVRPGMA